jgi:hypothetical protein
MINADDPTVRRSHPVRISDGLTIVKQLIPSARMLSTPQAIPSGKMCDAQNQALQLLLDEIHALDQAHKSRRTSRKIAIRLQPLVAFVDRYATALDVAVQGTCKPVAIIWGALRTLFVALKSFTHYFECFLTAVENLGVSLSIYAQYETLLGQNQVFRTSITTAYNSVLAFLERSKKLFHKKGWLHRGMAKRY